MIHQHRKGSVTVVVRAKAVWNSDHAIRMDAVRFFVD
jgi:hypothetical protein